MQMGECASHSLMLPQVHRAKLCCLETQLIFTKVLLGLLWHFFLGSRIMLIKFYPLLLLFLCFVSFTRFQSWGGGGAFFCCLSLYSAPHPNHLPISLKVQLLTSRVGLSGQFYLLFQIQYKIFWQFSNAVFLSRSCSSESLEELLKMVMPRLHLRLMRSDSPLMGSRRPMLRNKARMESGNFMEHANICLDFLS